LASSMICASTGRKKQPSSQSNTAHSQLHEIRIPSPRRPFRLALRGPRRGGHPIARQFVVRKRHPPRPAARRPPPRRKSRQLPRPALELAQLLLRRQRRFPSPCNRRAMCEACAS
jgi:hypothetical protein